LKNRLFFVPCLILAAMAAQAAPILTVGTPGDAEQSPATLPIPNLGEIFNFDSLSTSTSCQDLLVGCPTFAPTTFASQGVSSISSPDGLLVFPFSTQSGPNELFDNSSNGTANVTIRLANATTAIGIGIADSDGEVLPSLTITLQALNSTGGALGAPFVENLASTESLTNTGNGYYVIRDTTADIFGLQITQSVANANFSGLAIDDLQVAPEPSSFLLLATGAALLAFFRLRQRA